MVEAQQRQGDDLALGGLIDELENGKVPHGHSPTAYQPNTELDDSDFADYAKFSGIELLDLFVKQSWKQHARADSVQASSMGFESMELDESGRMLYVEHVRHAVTA